MRVISCLFLCCFILASCSKEDSVGKVGDRAIPKSDFDAFLKLKRIPADSASTTERALDEYLRREAITDAIANTDQLDQSLINAELNEYRKQLLISRYFESYLDKAVTEETVRNYYTSHAKDYETRQIHVAHILFRTRPDMAQMELQAVLTSAREAYSHLTSGENFDEVAKQVSEDKVSAKKGGDLGWINEGGISKKFSEMAFNTPMGSFTEPFATSYGYHIIKVIEGERFLKKPLETVAGDIRYQLRQEAKDTEVKRLLDALKYSKADS